MNQREKILAAAVLALVALWAGNRFYGNYAKTLRARQSDVLTAKDKLDVANRKLKDGHAAVKQIEEWQQRALPANFDKAMSLYKAWLLAKAEGAGLKVENITQNRPTSNPTAYKAVGYKLDAKGSLSSVVALLYEFYRSPQLHQVSRLQITPALGSPQLTLSLDVEALSLKGAVATDTLPEGDSKRLKLASADVYKKSLAERDLAAAYLPPRPPTPPREARETKAPAKFDESEQARFSGTTPGSKGLEAWIYVKPTGETLHLVAGDPVKIGALEGKIESVDHRSLVLKTGDKKFRVPLGEYIRKGKELGADGEVKTDSKTTPPKS